MKRVDTTGDTPMPTTSCHRLRTCATALLLFSVVAGLLWAVAADREAVRADAPVPDIEKAIRMSQEARRSHAQWVFYYRTYPVYRAKYESTRGTMEFHLKWVAHYDRVIDLLQRYARSEPRVVYLIPEDLLSMLYLWP